MPSGREVASAWLGEAVLNALVPSVSPGALEGKAPATVTDVTGLVAKAASVLAHQVALLPAVLPGGSGPVGSIPAIVRQEPAAALPTGLPAGAELERLRRQAHEMIETLLAVVSPRASVDTRVPLLRCLAPVAAGDEGRATLRVSNEESEAADVTLYCSNFVTDSGFDIPSLRVTISPRIVAIPPKGEASFELTISVPEQAPPGLYSGLVQATGTRYVKAVLTVEVK